MDESSELDGAFLGDVDGEQAAADVQVEVNRAGARWTIRKLGSSVAPEIIESPDPKVRHFQLRVHRALQRQATRHKSVTPDFKAPARKRAEPASMRCPACNGVEPEVWDCDRCAGGGVVPV